jgi:drug/metabolite transporter (DMT)-like permease
VRWNTAVAGLAASWGFISILVAAVDLDATVLVFYRLLLAAITVGLVATATGRGGTLRVGAGWPGLVAIGLVLAVHWTLFFLTIKLSSVAVAVVTVYTAPILIAIAAPIVLPEPRSRVAALALVPATAGVVMIALAGENGAHVRALALATGLGAAATYAALVIGGKRLRVRFQPVTYAFWVYTIAMVAMAPLEAFSGRVLPNGWRETGAVLLVGIVFTGVSGLIWVTLLGLVTAQTIGILAFLEPVTAALLAWALLDQPLGATVLAGGALVLAGGLAVVVAEPGDAAAVEAPPLDGRCPDLVPPAAQSERLDRSRV